MTEDGWAELGEVVTMREGKPTLRVASSGERVVCVRQGTQVHVLSDRCPHEGYPLSQGAVRDGVLTCNWHNWKFELASGACVFGGEAVRRYPSAVESGTLRADLRIDPVAERQRISSSLQKGLAEGELGGALRDALRLRDLTGSMDAAFGLLARDSARRTRWGFDHGLATLADVRAWVERGWVDPDDAFAAIAPVAAEPLLHLPPREEPATCPPALEEVAGDLRAERRAQAEARVRAAVRSGATPDDVAAALAPFVADHLLEYGHGAIYLAKALELAKADHDAAEDVLASVTIALSWATADSALPGWKATAKALLEAAAVGDHSLGKGALDEPGRYEAEILESERSAADATIRALQSGAAPSALLRVAARAAATRLGRFDLAWERRRDAPVTVLDVSHALTFAESALALDLAAPLAARMAVQAACFVGKLRSADRAEPPSPATERAEGRDAAAFPGDAAVALARAMEGHDLVGARAAAAELSGPTRATIWPALARFALLDAFVRPIWIAHAVKIVEAAHRMAVGDPEAASRYLNAALIVIVPRHPERFPRRQADIARRFLTDGRPPTGLY